MGMTELSIRERVALGVELLDEKESGWWRRINLETLDLGDCEQCIGGQLVGDYANAVVQWFGGDFNASLTLGFTAVSTAEFFVLEDEWRRVINDRRAADGDQVDVVVLG